MFTLLTLVLSASLVQSSQISDFIPFLNTSVVPTPKELLGFLPDPPTDSPASVTDGFSGSSSVPGSQARCERGNPCRRWSKYCVPLIHMWQFQLPDNDRIIVYADRALDEGAAASGTIKIRFSLGHSIYWWKGLKLFPKKGGRNKQRLLASLNGRKRGPVEIVFKRSQFDSNVLIFSKAKSWGIRRNMYCLRSPKWELVPGYTYNFIWTKDV